MGWLEVLRVIVALLPLVEAIVKKLEELFGNGGGARKRAEAVRMIRGCLPNEVRASGLGDEQIGRLVDWAVYAHNVSGDWVHSKPGAVDRPPVDVFGA